MKKFAPDKKYLIQTLTSTALFLVVTFLIIYLLYHVSLGFKSPPKTQPAIYGDSYETLSLDAYVFRDEHVIHSVSNGVNLYSATENEKLGLGATVATVYPAGTSTSVISQIEALETKSEVLTEASSRAHLLLDSSIIDSMIDSSLSEYVGYTESGDLHSAIKSAKELLVNLSRKELRISTRNNYDSQIASLNAQRESLYRSLGAPLQVITTSAEGYFSRKCDGYEQLFSYDSVMSMSCADFNEIIEKMAGVYQPTNVAGKIVESTEWYFVCPTDHNTTDSFSVGAEYSVKFIENMGTSLPATLVRIVTENETDNALLVFKCTRMPPDFEFLRSQVIQISVSRISGLEIPRASVRFIDGDTYVYILHGEKIYRRAVEIIGTAGDSYFVEDDTEAREVDGVTYYGIRLNDSVITYGTSLEHEKIYK